MVYDLNKKIFLKEIDNHNRFIYCSTFINDNTIAVGNNNGSVYLINLDKGEIIQRLEEHCLPIRSILYNKKSNLLYTASDDLHINVWDCNKFKVVCPIVGNKEKITSLALNEQKGILYSANSGGVIKSWEEKNNSMKPISTYENPEHNSIWDLSINKTNDTLFAIGDNYFGAFNLKKN